MQYGIIRVPADPILKYNGMELYSSVARLVNGDYKMP
jgi:hypothetical protein